MAIFQLKLFFQATLPGVAGSYWQLMAGHSCKIGSELTHAWCADPYSRALWASDESVINFIRRAPNSSNFLFVTYDRATSTFSAWWSALRTCLAG